MRKKRLLLLSVSVSLALLIVVTSLLAACAKPAPAPEERPPEPTTLIVNSWAYYPQVYLSHWVKDWCDDITKRTNGLLQFELFWGCSLGYKESTFLRVTRDGLAPIAQIFDSAIAGDIPEWTIGALPFLFDDYHQFDKFRQIQEPKFKEYLLEEWNCVLPANACVCDQSLMINKPIKTLDDLKGMKIRCLSEAEAGWLEAVGAVPVNIAYADCYSALQRGVADGLIMYAMGQWDMKYYEVLKYTPIRSIRSNWHYVLMNKDVWDGLHPQFKEAITEASKGFADKALASLDGLYEGSKAKLLEVGCDFTPLPESEMAKARALAEPGWEAYAAKYGSVAQEGVKVAREVTGH